MEKRKKKKAEFDKNIAITKLCIERDLKLQNKKSDEDYIDLPLINPATAKFVISSDIKAIIHPLFKQLGEYVAINNEYVAVKNLEEKNKV